MNDQLKKHNDMVREASGNITIDSKTVSFVYSLLCDFVKPGDIENIMMNIESQPVTYTNGWLAKYASNISNRLYGSQWLDTDPRYSINKRANIVILRPSPNGRFGIETGTGHVDTKEGWNIFTSFENPKRNFLADDKWDMDWKWTFAPK